MITFGVDAHKQLHMAVALDSQGRMLGNWRGPNSVDGWHELQHWAQSFAGEQQWGIEGAWNYGRGLAQHLVAAGAIVYDINPRWTAERRRSARKRDKSDAHDAQAIAKIVQEHTLALPLVIAETTDHSAVLDLLVTEREGALAEATRLRNQLHQLLLLLDPEYKQHLPALTTNAGLDALVSYTTTSERLLDQQRAATIQRLSKRLRLALEQATELEAQICTRATEYAPLAELCGVGLLTAGALAGILGPGQRFSHDGQLAALAGVAPLEASSAGRTRHRLNRGGNRRLNAILHRMAQTQARWSPQAQAYLERRQAEGKTRREAMRALKRYLIRAVWQRWKQCQKPEALASQPERQASQTPAVGAARKAA